MRWPLIITMLVLAGCTHNPIGDLIVTKGAKEREVAALRADYAKQMDDLRVKQGAAAKLLVESMRAQMQGAASAYYGQDYIYRTLPKPARTDILWHNLAIEGWQSIGNLAPTYEAMQAMNERLTRELDETRTSLTDLQTSHKAALDQNKQLADLADRHRQELTALQETQHKLESDYHSKLDAAQTSLTEAQNGLIAAEKASADQRKAQQAQLAKLSWGAGAIAAACIIAAIFLPVFREAAIIGGVVFGGAAVAIPFVNGLYILIGVGVAVVGVGLYVASRHSKEEKLSDGLVLAIQRFKDQHPEAAAKLDPIVTDQLARYGKKDGATVVKPDPAMAALMESKLKDYQQLDAKPL